MNVNTIKQHLFQILRNTYHSIPVNNRIKHFLKDSIFRIFAFAIRNTSSYKKWKNFYDIKSRFKNISEKRTGAFEDDGISAANGIWEWKNLHVVRTNVEHYTSKSLQEFSPERISLFQVDRKNLVDTARSVMLPELTDTPLVSIIIPVFNNIVLTLECLLSLSRYNRRADIEVIVANDASTDETEDILKYIDHLRLINNTSNVGFLRNCNNAARHARGKYLLFLNNDVQVTENWLDSLLSVFRKHDNTGVAGPKIIYPSGHLQEAGVSISQSGESVMIGLNDDPDKSRYSYTRRVDYVSGACMLIPGKLFEMVGGFSDEYAPCYNEDSDLCLKVQEQGYDIYYCHDSQVIHHLSSTTASVDSNFKISCISRNLAKFSIKWREKIDSLNKIRFIAFYLPQFHRIPENDEWWGEGFTEWTNVRKAKPNFANHFQPRVPADLGYYDLSDHEIMEKQARLAKRYGIEGFCYYYYKFGDKRLLEKPIETMLSSKTPNMPFCLCWANENWTRRWDGKNEDVLMAQTYSEEDDIAVIKDLIRYFRDERYITIDGKPLILVYRVKIFPDFSKTAERWRQVCRNEGIGEIYIAMVECFNLVHQDYHPSEYGCDAAVEFPPHGMDTASKDTNLLVNRDFKGTVANYNDIAVWYSTRKLPDFSVFRGVMPSWDNTARRQNDGVCIENSTPGAFQAWIEYAIRQTKLQNYGEEQIIFINAWNEWAEGTYLEPDQRFGHSYLQAVKNAQDAESLIRKNKNYLGDDQT